MASIARLLAIGMAHVAIIAFLVNNEGVSPQQAEQLVADYKQQNETPNVGEPAQIRPQVQTEPQPQPQPQAEPQSSDITVDEIVQRMLEQEGVLKYPGKTPIMAKGKWRKSILRTGLAYGFEVDKAKMAKSNFIHLKNPSDVPKIVRFLIEERYPGRFGLTDSPTLRELIPVFDQSNSAGKIEYMMQKMPLLDLDKPLSFYK